MEVLIRKFGLLVCFLSVISGFSITSYSKPLHESELTTEDKYDCLVKLFMGEHTARLKLRQQVNQKQLQQHQQSTQRSPEETLGANEDIDTRFTKLEKKYNSLLQKQESLYNDLQTFVNQSQKHQDKHTRLEEKIAMLEEKNNKLEANVFESENVHSFFALNTSHELELIMDKQQELETELHNTSAVTSLQNVVQKLIEEQDVSRQKISDSLSQIDMRIDIVNQDLNATRKDLKFSTKRVSLTACLPVPKRRYSGSTILKFSNIKSEYGVVDIAHFKSTGNFTCSYAGLYLLTVTLAIIPSHTFKAQILKNTKAIVEIHDGPSKSDHSSTGVATVALEQNDVISFRTVYSTEFYGDWSCVTVVKIN